MKQLIEQYIKTWDWKWQTIWSHKTWESWLPIDTLVNRIDSWFYLTKEIDLDLSVLNLATYSFQTEDLFDFMTHYKLVENSDLKYPIILNRRWQIVDWRHRLCKAILQGKKNIKWIMILDSDVYE